MTSTRAFEVSAWHSTVFPRATSSDLFVKTTEELGEVAEALSADEGRNSKKSPEGLSVVEEAADVIICLMALCGRYYEADVMVAVEAKFKLLMTPGAHRASISV